MSESVSRIFFFHFKVSITFVFRPKFKDKSWYFAPRIIRFGSIDRILD